MDGVLTDGKIWYLPNGEEFKNFHIHDGLGIKNLLRAQIEVAIISGRNSPLVLNRMRELGVKHCYLGENRKLIPYTNLIQELQISPEAVAYVGDDLPDLPVMQTVGFPIAVANAVPEIKKIAAWTTEKKGGEGAVREICDFILSTRSRS